MNRTEFEEHIKSMSHIPTFEEVKAFWDEKVKTEEGKWGPKDFWTQQAIGLREKALKDFQEGIPVEFYEEWDHFGYGFYGEDVIARLYSDGTYKFEYHSAD